VPNQEKDLNGPTSVTYHDNPTKLPMILLPIRELMQALSALTLANPFWLHVKQEWEFRGFNTEQFSNQKSRSIFKAANQFPRLALTPAASFRGWPEAPDLPAAEAAQSTR
jgi:hypothetical protein